MSLLRFEFFHDSCTRPAVTLVLTVLLLFTPDILLSQTDRSAFDRARDAVETITGKDFRSPVAVESQSRANFQEYLREQLRSTYTHDELKAFSKIYAQLGLLPDDYDLHANLLELYRSQSGAYYDPSSGTIRTIGERLSDPQMYFIYLHELVHAHQDQYYDLPENRQTRMTDSFDSLNAFNFVIEGHANLVSMASQFGVERLDEAYFSSKKHLGVFRLLTRFTSIDLEQLDLIEQLAGSSQITRSLRMMQNTPDVLVKQMVDPYFWGQYYWYEEATQTDWEKTLTWLKNPPGETRRIIYRNAESFSGTGFTVEPSIDKHHFSDSLGVYFLLRWYDRLDQRPSWGQFLREDRLYLKSTSKDHYLTWVLEFSNTEAAQGFVNSFETDSSGTVLRTKLKREHGTAYLTLRRNGTNVVLFVEDDPERETYPSIFPVTG